MLLLMFKACMKKKIMFLFKILISYVVNNLIKVIFE